MRHRRLLPLLGIVAATFASCLAGPHQLRRSVDDWDHRLYVESPWFDVGMWVVPVIPLTSLFASLADFLVVDPYFFWGSDAWDGNGTGFEHFSVRPDTWAESLLIDHTAWMRIEEHDLPAPVPDQSQAR